jgi:DNA-binding NarL/FixJ family response regulator
MLLTSESQKQIARTLRLSQYTVRDYVKQVYRRLGVESRAEIMSRYTASISK